MVSSARPLSSSHLSSTPILSSCSSIFARTTSVSARPSATAFLTYSSCGCDQMWIAVVLNQQKNGLSPSLTRLSQSIVLSSTSPSNVSIRLRVSGPVFSNFCLPTRPNTGSSVGSSLSVAHAWNTPRGPYFLVYSGSFWPGYSSHSGSSSALRW